MKKVSFVFRFNISEVVYPRISDLIFCRDELNYITGGRVRREFLTREAELPRTIKSFVDQGKVIPKQYWWPFWTTLLEHNAHNIYTTLVGDVEQLMEFERHLNDSEVSIVKIIHLRVNDADKLASLARQKYSKIYDHSDTLTEQIKQYDTTKDELIAYAKTKYNVIVDDFFTKRIEI